MRLLLDTHTFIWWDSEPVKLSAQALALCQDRQNSLLLSVASVWETQIKFQLGKLKLTLLLSELIEHEQQTNHLDVLPILLPHVLVVQGLPAHHKDPFARLLIAQANVEDVMVVSNDPMFPRYTDKVLW
jgi:PIN domain nuclease of toxin-antitoxin system